MCESLCVADDVGIRPLSLNLKSLICFCGYFSDNRTDLITPYFTDKI